MKKRCNIIEYDPKLYPRKLWVATEVNKLDKEFIFIDTENNEEDTSIYREILQDYNQNKSIAITCAVMNAANNELGVLVVLMDTDKVDTEVIAHESVHVADYFYEQLGLYSQDFSKGNEAYAYLVGWSAGCISNTLIKNKKQND